MSLLRDKLGDPWWRLCNLYRIVNQDGVDIPFVPNAVQSKYYRERAYRNIILKSRQHGITTFIQLLALDMAMFSKNKSAVTIAHTVPDAGRIFREKIKFGYDNLPPEIRAKVPTVKNEAGELLLANGSGIRVTTSARSAAAQRLHVSELSTIAAARPNRAKEIVTGSFPSIHPGNWLDIESTAKGKEGVFYDLCDAAEKRTARGGQLGPLDFRFHFFPWWINKNNILAVPTEIPERLVLYFAELEPKIGCKLTDGQKWWYTATEESGLGTDMLSEHPSTSEEAFAQSIEGAYYKTELLDAYRDGRVCEVPWIPELPVHTCWDIGEDCTAIWFFQLVKGMIHVIRYFDHSGEGLPFYIKKLQELPYRYGRYIYPKDIKNREWGTGRSRPEIMVTDYGIAFESAPALSVEDGIGAVRKMFRRVRFDESNCDTGIARLTGYRKDWNAIMGTWKTEPRHDMNSHGADAFRMMAVSDLSREDAPTGNSLMELINRCTYK